MTFFKLLFITLIVIVLSLSIVDIKASIPDRDWILEPYQASTLDTISNVVTAKDKSGAEMVYVPGGTFELGISYNALSDFCRKVLHEADPDRCVELLGVDNGIIQSQESELASFWIDRYEVTIEQYKACASPGPVRGCSSINQQSPNLSDDPLKPQTGVSWYDAVILCNLRGARLPTEREWEYAASGPLNVFFPWGNVFNEHFVTSQSGVFPSKSTYPVGNISENVSWIGAYDLVGNVAEWVEDRFLPYLPTKDWLLQGDAFETSRVVRGGSWGSGVSGLTTFDRVPALPEESSPYRGFRCARSTHP